MRIEIFAGCIPTYQFGSEWSYFEMDPPVVSIYHLLSRLSKQFWYKYLMVKFVYKPIRKPHHSTFPYYAPNRKITPSVYCKEIKY